MTYDRSAVGVGIVHLGVGGVHRAHQAMYLDRLMSGGQALDWGICGVGLLPGDARMRDAMHATGCRYTLVVKHADGRLEPQEIGSVVDYLFAPDDPEAVLARLTDPATRVVSLTVTEGGYHVHRVTGELDVTGLEQDLVAGAVPTTAFGYLTESLVRRRAAGVPPYVVLSCDNILGNGHVARRMLSAFAELREPGLGDWVAEHVPFPSSMVDRITPVTTDADRAVLAEIGVTDPWPVVCEPWVQWVMEDHDGRPAWEDAGVQVVDDVEPYELMKLRLLNGSHQAMAYLGHLLGHTYAHEAAADDDLVRLLRDYMAEVTPTLRPVPGIDLADYQDALVDRFANPAVADTLARLCAESSDRIPNWMVPIAVELVAAGRPVDVLALVVASWARYAQGTDEQGRPIEVVDRLREERMAAAANPDPLAFLENRDLFGPLVDEPSFTEPYLRALTSLREKGARATLSSRG